MPLRFQHLALARFGAALFARIAERHATAGKVSDDLHWRRASFLRMSGQLQAAVTGSDVLHDPEQAASPTRHVLAAVRAAALLDMFDADGDARWLSLAQQAAAVALAKAPRDDVTWNIKRRLKRRNDGWAETISDGDQRMFTVCPKAAGAARDSAASLRYDGISSAHSRDLDH
jgi:hypothetical protein